MLTQPQLLSAVTAAAASISGDVAVSISVYKEVHDFFNSYLIGKYPEKYLKYAAAILTANFFQCSNTYDYGTDDFILANEQALINELALFATFFQSIFTVYNNENTAVADAAILAKIMTAEYCTWISNISPGDFSNEDNDNDFY